MSDRVSEEVAAVLAAIDELTDVTLVNTGTPPEVFGSETATYELSGTTDGIVPLPADLRDEVWRSEGITPETYPYLTEGWRTRVRATGSPLLPMMAVGMPLREKVDFIEKPEWLRDVVYPSPARWVHIKKDGPNRCQNRNAIYQMAKSLGVRWLFMSDDDTYPERDAFVRLLDLARQLGGDTVVGGHYNRKTESIDYPLGAPVVLQPLGRTGLLEGVPLNRDGRIHEVFIIPMGLTLIPMSVFEKLGTEAPFGEAVPVLDDDHTFSQLCWENGVKMLVDTSITARHLNVQTGRWF